MLGYRNIDGTDNNEVNPQWGSTDEWFLRKTSGNDYDFDFLEVFYEDGISSPAVYGRPSAREISNTLFSQEGDVPNSIGASDFLWVWGQFLDHDIDLTMGGGAMFNIEVPLDDPFFDPFGTGTQEIMLFRSGFADGTGTGVEPGQQVTQITAFIDASQIYGSDAARAEFLREPDESGKLKLEDGFLPYNTGGFDNAPHPGDSLFLAGDVRANENTALTSMHTLFVREHNRLVDELAAQHPDWDGDTLYQEAKMLVEAELQSITYNEYLPVLLGAGALDEYSGYDATVDPSIANLFATAAFRFGHSQLSSFLTRVEENGATIALGDLQLRDAFFNPDILLDGGGVDPILRGIAESVSQEIDLQMIDDVRNFLFGPPGSGGFDLAALNIQRGRDHGLPDYNTARELYGLERVDSFADITSDVEIQEGLEALFGTVDNIDVFVGGLAEDHTDGSMLGELFHTVLVNQFTRLRDGDSFFYLNRFEGDEDMIAMIEGISLSDIIQMNTGVEHLQDNVFIAYDRVGGTDKNDMMQGSDGHDLIFGGLKNDLVSGLGDDDHLFGDEGHDKLFGGDGQDILEGGAGADNLWGGVGADMFRFALTEGDDGLWTLEDGSKDHLLDFSSAEGDVIAFEIDFDFNMDVPDEAATFHTQGNKLHVSFDGGGELVVMGLQNVTSFDDPVFVIDMA